MRTRRIWMILATTLGLAAAGAANAEITSTWTLTSDYDYRGTTQTDGNPALQASFDYSHESGWYLGAWASNVNFPGYDGRLEVDLTTGFAGTTEGGLDWDAGLVWYTYPTSERSETKEKIADYPEIYFSLGYGPFQGKLWYSNKFSGTDKDGFYVDLNGTFPLPNNFSVLTHVGHSSGKSIDILYEDSYFDYSAGIGYTAGNFDLSLRYQATDIDDSLGYKDRVIFTIETKFPWGSGKE